MTAEFFILALTAAVNPSLLAVDLVLIMNRRPRAMLAFVLLGGMVVAIVIGLIDVFIIRANVVKSQGGLSAGANLALGLLALAGGCLLLRRRPASPGGADRETRMQRALREPRLGLAVLAGGVLGLPGVLYLTAMHGLITGTSSTTTKVIGIIVFAIIEFTLLIVPLLTLAARPAQTEAMLRRTQAWLARHGRRAAAYAAFVLGAYLTISAAVSLAG